MGFLSSPLMTLAKVGGTPATQDQPRLHAHPLPAGPLLLSYASLFRSALALLIIIQSNTSVILAFSLI